MLRTKISRPSTAGTPGTEDWHTVRSLRTREEGRIPVDFDDLNRPVMLVADRRSTFDPIGLGSFDDTSPWDDREIRG